LKKGTTLRVCGALAAVGALSIVVAGGSASAEAKRANAAVITMEQGGRGLFFDGPRTVERGQELKIKNLTNPSKSGPHTFSLVNRKLLPDSGREFKRCFQDGICGEIAKWHQIDFDTFEVGRNPVEAGKDGWNQQGNLKRKGDSWYSEAKNESFKREVTAQKGKALHFICAFHPEMQGKIKVED
jgi:hypothetical protein